MKADGKIEVPNAATGDVISPPAGSETAKTMSEAGDKLDKAAKEIRAAEKCTYNEALAKARAAHPAWAKVYDGKEE
jgi:TRAP-type mannitol/chloroaromatic compound transport system substrate-binding protein